MDAAKPSEADRDEAEARRARPPRSHERARAAAYLDLWERHLAQIALRGREPAGPPPGAR